MSTRPFRLAGLFFLAIALSISPRGWANDEGKTNQPLLAVLKQFENAPAKGPEEADMPVRKVPGFPLGTWPGKGLAQHPFLLYGEGNNVLYVVNHGQVIWTYAFPSGGEIDDAWMLSNGHIICTKMTDCYEVTPQKQIVWTYHCPPNTQIHALQPVGLDQVMIVENGEPPHFYILNKKDNSKALSHELPTPDPNPNSIHGQFRNCRITAQGTYLINSLTTGNVNEYDKKWNLIWTYKSPGPWSAVRLKNGNTLIPGDNHAFVHEVNPKGEIVWAVEHDTLLPDIVLRDVQTVSRLANGDTLICSRGNPPRPHPPAPSATSGNAPAQTSATTTAPAVAAAPAPAAPTAPAPPYVVQAVEITPDKKIVWVLQDYKDLPACTGIQLLDEPGTPETPGDLER